MLRSVCSQPFWEPGGLNVELTHSSQRGDTCLSRLGAEAQENLWDLAMLISASLHDQDQYPALLAL